VKIAVVGAGVAGLVAAHRLQRNHDVVLFEADGRLGGHAHTVSVSDAGRVVPIDTGFLVLNTRTYPNFLALLGELGVPTAPSDMGFSVRSDRRDFEYNARNLATLYAQRRNLVRLDFHRMVLDTLRFFREARTIYGQEADLPLGVWLERHGYCRAFVDDHLVPLVRAVWSARRDVALAFPARFLVRFFDNHGFLQAASRSPWLTIPGGSKTYVDAIRARFRGRVRAAAPVESISRRSGGGGVIVRAQGLAPERFDHAVVACHADQALAMVDSPSDVERELLAAFPYQDNETILHTDARLMPRRSRVWASWNVHLDDEGQDGACITYWINRLQPLNTPTNYFVTLNRTRAIDPSKILRTFRYAHPIFGLGTEAAQARHPEMIDRDGISYCGAYWRNGFHEDGVVSALRVVGAIERSRAELAA
jgi:predicted NAD/FAD-binding protein